MQAVILAGGLGTRLRPITETIPKPMVPVAGKPYLEHQLRELARQGVNDIVLLTGYLGEQVEQYFGDGAQLGLRIKYSKEPHPLGTGGAVRLAAALLEDDFLLIYGDSYLPVDYPAVLNTLRRSKAEGLLVVYDNRLGDTSVISNVNFDEATGMVTRYEKDGEGLCYVEAGVLAFRKSVLGLLSDAPVVSLEKEVFPQLIARGALAGYSTTQRFYDIGTPDRLEAFEAYLKQ
jgi:NDP-sugar pyrophosphorylase family protein